MNRLTAAEINKRYSKVNLVKFVRAELQKRSMGNPSWKGLPNLIPDYDCLNKLNRMVLIKIYECLMMLD